MFLVIDNYDSFVHNLARYFELAGVKTRVIRNDAIDIASIRELDPEALKPMLGVDVAYLRTAFEAIDAEFGSADAYVTDVLGVGAREREALRKNYLEC